ncbi:MAG: SurA N-terminal domain-containing protein, partial [Bdellovibrionales bacterium]|nr:SurA N-terminal domain-containing protein [Bdellovibrionales bacterium]
MVKRVGTILIFGSICFVFIFVGYNALHPTGNGYAARVNDNYVSFQQFRAQYESEAERYRQILGDKFLGDSGMQSNLRQMVLNRLVQGELQLQAAM